MTTIDGVPVLLAPADGQVRAGLLFRVGRADETLAGSGVTRLVQRLALPVGADPVQPLDATGTEFRVAGTPAEVVAFLDAVCAALGDLPVDRLDVLRAALIAEAAGHVPEPADDLPMFRHGARDHGLPSYPEWGLHQLTVADVDDWAQSFFTRDNAVLWLVADAVPDGLRLPLPPGLRRAVPKPSSALPITPAYFAGESDAVIVDAIVGDGPAADLFAALLEHDLRAELLGGAAGPFAAEVSATAVPRGDGHAVVTATVSPLPDNGGAVLGGLLDVLTRLKVGGPDAAALATVRARIEERLYRPGFAAERLPAAARDLLTDRPDHTQEQRQDELRTLGTDAVRGVAADALATALLMVPPGQHVDWAGFAPAPLYSRAAVPGARYPSRDIPGVTLVVGPRGVCLETPEGPVTVRFDQCAAALGWPDGGRHLIGEDGIAVRIEPGAYPIDATVVAGIDAAVPPGAALWLPPRDGRPGVTPEQAAAAGPVQGAPTVGPPAPLLPLSALRPPEPPAPQVRRRLDRRRIVRVVASLTVGVVLAGIALGQVGALGVPVHELVAPRGSGAAIALFWMFVTMGVVLGHVRAVLSRRDPPDGQRMRGRR